jgi:outer membrane lipoprotein-sorting protein
MRTTLPRASIAALALPLLLTGCSIFPTTRRLPVPKPPLITQSATPEELVERLNQRWNAINTLTATVEIYATQTKTAEGLEKDFPSCRGFIVMRKPKQLRVAGTYFGVKIFDMASDGQHFTLVMPTKNLAIEGPNTVTEKSTNSLENLRPDFFLNAIIVPGLDAEDEYMVENDTETVEDTAKKHLFIEPEYILNIMRRRTEHVHLPVRVVTFHRDDMLPYGQDIYDANGNAETEITYSNYTDYNSAKYPSKVTIKRPQEGIQIVLSVIRVEENVNLPASQFEVSIPDGAKVRTLH